MTRSSNWRWCNQQLRLRELFLVFLAGVPRFRLRLHRNGVLMEFGCCILWQHLCIANKGGEILLVQFQDPPSLAD